jgi:hypothetical protein
MNVTIDSGAGVRSSTAIRQQVIPGKLRMELVQLSGTPDASDAEGMYTIIVQADSTMTQVIPSQRMAMVTSSSIVTGALGPVTPRFASHATRRSVEDLGAGERILGHATHRYRVTGTSSVDITFGGQTCTQRTDTESEIWIAPDVDLQSAISASQKFFGDQFGASAVESTDTTGQRLPKGAPLRTLTKSTSRSAAGVATTTTMKSEIVELSNGPIDPSLFVVPSDYKTMDTRAVVAELPAGMMDSLMQAQAPKMMERLCGSR